MKPLVLDYLLTHTFEELEQEHGINARPDVALTKASLNYDQLSSKPGELISEQCRGLIVRPKRWTQVNSSNWKADVVGECDVIARPFDRFYNHGDPHAVEIDLDDPELRVYEKLDGTMVALYWDDLQNEWCIATRSVPEADLPFNEDGLTFSELFWRGLRASFDDRHRPTITEDFLSSLSKNFTYVFELTSPLNRVVVRYDDTKVTLLGARCNETGVEADLNVLVHGVPRVRSFTVPLTMQQLLEQVASLKPEEREGVVLCAPTFDRFGRTSSFKRVKLKSPSYVLSHRFKDKLTFSRSDVVQSILDGTIDDVLPSLEPSMVAEVDDIKESILRFLDGLQSHFDLFRESAQGDRKSFALLVQASGLWHVPFFSIFKTNSSIHEWVISTAKAGKMTRNMLDIILYAAKK